MKIFPVGAELFRADGGTHRHDGINSCFRTFRRRLKGKDIKYRRKNWHTIQ